MDHDKSLEIRKDFPDVPNLGGPYDPGMATLREVPANSGGNRSKQSEAADDRPDENQKRPRSAAGRQESREQPERNNSRPLLMGISMTSIGIPSLTKVL